MSEYIAIKGEQVAELMAENKRLRKALEWALPIVDRWGSYHIPDFEKARQALEVEK